MSELRSDRLRSEGARVAEDWDLSVGSRKLIEVRPIEDGAGGGLGIIGRLECGVGDAG